MCHGCKSDSSVIFEKVDLVVFLCEYQVLHPIIREKMQYLVKPHYNSDPNGDPCDETGDPTVSSKTKSTEARTNTCDP